MRFNILVAASFFVALAAGHVIPASARLSSRGLEVRDNGLVKDTTDILVREPALKKALSKVVNAFKPKYHVPSGGPGKPARAFI